MYVPAEVVDDRPTRPSKRRKVGKQKSSIEEQSSHLTPKFDALLKGKESLECIQRRYELYEQAWSQTEAQIQVRVVERIDLSDYSPHYIVNPR